MKKKTDKKGINWKTVIACTAFLGIGGGWMVTANMTQDNKKEIKETQGEVKDLKEIVYEQKTMNTSQYAINTQLVNILEEWKGKK